MEVHDLSGGGDVLDRVERVALRALRRYDVPPDAPGRARQRVGERHLPDRPAGSRTAVLRVHRTGYHPPGAVGSELAWLQALRRDEGLLTPAVSASADGRRSWTSTRGR